MRIYAYVLLIMSLLLAIQLAPIANAQLPSVTIDANVASQTYNFTVAPPVLIKITFEGLQPNTAVDNLALSFRDNSTTPREIFVLYVKTNGNLVLHVPIANVTTDQLLGSWQDLPSITVRYWSDKLQVLDPNGNVLYEVGGSFPAIHDIWAHSSDTNGTAAFTAGSIVVEAQDDPSVVSRQISEMLLGLMPLIVTLIGFAFAIGIMDKILSTVTRLFR